MPRFGHHPRAKELRFTEPKAEVLAKQAQVVFLALPHGVAAEYAVPLLQHGALVIDLSADFRLKSAEVYKEFRSEEHTSELQSQSNIVCRLLLEKKKQLISVRMGKLDRPDSSLPYLRLTSTIQHLRKDARYAFMLEALALRDNIAVIISPILRVP